MKREHVHMLAAENFVADFHDQIMRFLLQAPGGEIGMSGRFLEDRVGLDHLLRNQVASDREVLQGALRLCAPQLVGWHRHFSKAIGFNTKVAHLSSSLGGQGAWSQGARMIAIHGSGKPAPILS
jgi:hypothetical protein